MSQSSSILASPSCHTDKLQTMSSGALMRPERRFHNCVKLSGTKLVSKRSSFLCSSPTSLTLWLWNPAIKSREQQATVGFWSPVSSVYFKSKLMTEFPRQPLEVGARSQVVQVTYSYVKLSCLDTPFVNRTKFQPKLFWHHLHAQVGGPDEEDNWYPGHIPFSKAWINLASVWYITLYGWK